MPTVAPRSTSTSTTTNTTALARNRTHVAAEARVPAYRRRRVAAAAATVAVLAGGALGVHGVLTGPGDVPASAAGTGTASPNGGAVRAEPGDTLWAIAQLHRGPVSLRRYLAALIDRNGGTTAIQAGQLVHLP